MTFYLNDISTISIFVFLNQNKTSGVQKAADRWLTANDNVSASQINVDNLAEELLKHPDRHFVQYLLDGILYLSGLHIHIKRGLLKRPFEIAFLHLLFN
jgi:hypothetical protein